MTDHWTHYNAHEGPSFLPEDGRTLMISVVLDSGAKKNFGGIRVVVVCQESGGAELSMTEMAGPARSDYVTGASYRKALISLRSGQDSNGLALHANTKELCTIVFELASDQSYWGQYASLSLIGHKTPQPSLRVIHEHVERDVSSTVFFLHCSHSSQPYFSPGGEIRKPTRVRAHSVRVIPVPKSRLPWPSFNLVPTVLSRIILFAFSDRQKGWRKGLLSCSLVCRAWAHLIEFFFNDFDQTNMNGVDHDPPNIITVARSLQRNVFYGSLMKTYSPSKYLRPTRVTSVAFMAFCEAQNMILRLSKDVTDIVLESTHAFLFQDFIDILCGLREVRCLRVIRSQRFGPSSAGDIRHLTFGDILRVISHWPQLKKLKIVNWKLLPDSRSEPASDGTGGESGELSCGIENLNLSIGTLGRGMLLGLTGPISMPPTLRIVRLDSVNGLTNSDFLAFLTRVAPTLASLSVSACPMPRRSADEEYAVDAAMPNLASLECLILDGEYSSAKALSRKVWRQKRADGGERHRISLSNPPMMKLEDVLDAMSVTGWESICVYLDSSIGHSPKSSAAVTRAACDRDIEFRISVSPRELEPHEAA